MLHKLLDVINIINRLLILALHNFNSVKHQQSRDISRRLGAINRTPETHLVKIRNKSAVVNVSVGKNNRVQLLKVKLRRVQNRIRLLTLTRDIDTAVHNNSRLRSLKEDATSTNLSRSAKMSNTNPLVLLLSQPAVINTVANFVQEFSSVIRIFIQNSANIVNNLRLQRRSSSNLRNPESLFANFFQKFALLTNRHTGLVRLNDNDRTLSVKQNSGNTGLFRQNLFDCLFRFFLLHTNRRVRP